jgi:UDP-N-acetyl-D-mannosaminuronic acid dehydrogenase
MIRNDLRKAIETRKVKVGVVGLGYVGLPLACILAEAGFSVIGLELRKERVRMINEGISPIKAEEPGLDELLNQVVRSKKLRATVDANDLHDARIITINVETPVENNHEPKYDALFNACQSIGSILGDGTLVIVESTVAPGTTSNQVIPILENISKKKVNRDFFVGICPERVMPGKLLANLREMSRVCGGSTADVAKIMVAFYKSFVNANVDATNLITAELVKTVENSYRDVQIAFANEIAQICELLGADVFQVRELVNKVPYRQMHLPGSGVGGHCIPKDPWLLAYSVKEHLSLKMIPSARAVNDEMPIHIGTILLNLLEQARIDPKKSKVAILGIAYLENSDDTRNSPTIPLIRFLENKGIEVIVHDPFVPPYNKDLLTMIRDNDALIIMVGHQAYCGMDLKKIKSVLRHPILIDGRHIFLSKDVKDAGFTYYCIGQGG